MRITTGTHKGRNIKVPKGEVRPTKDMVRQAIFSIIGDEIKGRIVADLFAGSGSLGLEALSRGAEHCDFIDDSSTTRKTLQENINDFRLWGQAEIYEMDVLEYLKNVAGDEYYDILFADPPYDYQNMSKLIKTTARVLRIRALLVLEHTRENNIFVDKSNEFELIDRRTYGITVVSFLQKMEEEKKINSWKEYFKKLRKSGAVI